MELLNVWLPPAAIITVVIYTNRLLANGINGRIDGINKRIDDLGTSLNKRIDGIDKRIDDLRNQMTREHDTLAKKLTHLLKLLPSTLPTMKYIRLSKSTLNKQGAR